MKQFILLPLLALCACAHHDAPSTPTSEHSSVPVVYETPKTLKEAVKSPYRSEAFKVRDMFRNPEDTLTFFGVKPTMKVLEITPGTGWYTEILAPFLSEKGQYLYATHPAGSPAPQTSHIADWSKKFPDVSKNMSTTVFDLSKPDLSLGEDHSVDMVLTFRNVHNWMAAGKEEIAFKSFFKVLKKGGVLGVVEHRAPKDRVDPKAATGYVREADVMKMAKAAGFKYVGKSEVNSNKLDTKDYDKGVWTLPPTLALKDKDREHYQAIGESDRMTLKFVKP